MDVTLSIDDDLLSKAKEAAARRGTSVDQMIHAYLEDLATEWSAEEILGELEELWRNSFGDSTGQTWTREDLHGRANVR